MTKTGTFARRALPALAVAVAVAWSADCGPAAAADAKTNRPNVMLILDSSRSMWGQIDEINKVVSTRNAIGKVADRYAGRLNFGLLAYGHRQSSGCDDLEVVLPLGAHPAKTIAKTVSGIKPKGSTPIASSLTKAAEAAQAAKRSARLVLISDGLDNCKGDPCATAATLKRQSKDLAIHVIAFDRKDREKLKALSCIADKSGGTFASATNESELLDALDRSLKAMLAPPPPTPKPSRRVPLQAITEVSTQPSGDPAVTGTGPEPAGAQKTAAATQPKKPAPPKKPVPVTLTALLTEAGPKIETGLVWRIFKAQPTRSGRHELVSTHRDATPTAALLPGDYLVNAAYGLSNLTRKIEVRSGSSLEESFTLNAGGVRLGAVFANGDPISPNSVRYDIYADEADQFGNREKVMSDAKPGLIIRLNAGTYHIVSVYGDANAVVRADVTVEPGRLTEATINHSAAKVTFKLVLQPGGEALANTRWTILTPSGDVVKESAGALPTHILAAGKYTVQARHDGKNYPRDFKLDPGEVKQVEVVIR